MVVRRVEKQGEMAEGDDEEGHRLIENGGNC